MYTHLVPVTLNQKKIRNIHLPTINIRWLVFFLPQNTIKSENTINRIYRKVGVNYRTQLYKA